MERKAMASLKAWKCSAGRRPLVVRGLRQVGKTWLVEEFGRTCFESTVTVNMDSPADRGAFNDPTDVDAILRAIAARSGEDVGPDTLLFIDEVQSCPNALTSLKYFCEKSPETHVVVAGSLLGVSAGRQGPFPVGKVDTLTLRPMDFEEFLSAVGRGRLADILGEDDRAAASALSADYEGLLKEYMMVGGMPACVGSYAGGGGLTECRRIQEALLAGYDADMGRHPPSSQIAPMRAVWDSIPEQLSKDGGRKFVYSVMKSKGGASRYYAPIRWLCDYGLLVEVDKVSAPGTPLSSYADGKSFKLFAADVGLLCAKARLPVSDALEEGPRFAEFKGALAEQFAVQELVARGVRPHYWTNDRGTAEVDLLAEIGGRVVPIEVKSSVNLKSKSLKAFHERYGIEPCVRAAPAGFKDEGWLVNIPLHDVGNTGAVLARREEPGQG